jgi:hypothetical protein
MDYLLIILTAIATSAATQLAIYTKDRWTWGREAKFSALYSALFFEQYASECSRTLGELEAFSASEGHAGTNHGSIPTLPVFPKEIDWQRLGIRPTESAFGFRVEVESTAEMIAFLYNENPPDGGDWDICWKCTELGLKALELAKIIRSMAKLCAATETNSDYTIKRYLTERRAHYQETSRNHLEQQDRVHRDMTQRTASMVD